MITVSDVSYTYRQPNAAVQALADVSLELPEGGSCAVIGPSGCGKTTLLYLLAGLLDPASGSVLVRGQPAAVRRSGTSLILQDYGLLPWKTVWDNARLGLQIRREPRSRQEKKVREVLAFLGLSGLESHYPAQVSGGQRQRVAIARSLATDPDLLLMDEPLSSLDALTREELQDAILDILTRGSLSFVLVTHNIEEAVYLGQRILVMSGPPGRLVEVVENQGAGRRDYRGTGEFHRQCDHLRGLLTGIMRSRRAASRS
jgi:NitT/TauT family transport system ATP-binding protein